MSESPKSAKREFSSAERLALIALAMILVQLIFRGWATAGSWFYSDDFIFLGSVAHGDADFAWLFHPHNVHFMPFGLLLAKFVGSVGTYSWLLAATQILVLQAIASVLCWWMLRTLFGDRRGVLVALGFYLFGTLSFPTVTWWAASLNQLPHQIALFGAIAAHVHYVRKRHLSSLVLATLFMILGYASYSKTLLLPIVLVTLTVLYFATGKWLARCKMAFTRFWPAWLAYGTLTIAYLVMYAVHMPKTKAPALQDVLGTLNVSITQSFGAGMVGGPWHWQSLLQPGGVGTRLFVATPIFFVMLSWLVVAALWAYQSLRYKRAWWPLLILGPYLVLSSVLIATGRAGAFGIGPAALELRYLADMAGVGALCLGLAMMPVVGSSEGIKLRDPPMISLHTPRWIPRVLIAAFLVGSIVSSIGYARPWHNDKQMPQRQFITNARADLAKGGFQVADTGVPDEVLWSVAFPDNQISRILAPIKDKFTVVDAGNDLKVIDRRGHLTSAMIEGDPRTKPGKAEGCGFPVSGLPRTIHIAPVFNFPFWMTINYLAGAEGIATVTAGATTVEVPIEQGAHTLFLRTEGDYDGVTIAPGQGVSMCVDNIKVGQITAQESP